MNGCASLLAFMRFASRYAAFGVTIGLGAVLHSGMAHVAQADEGSCRHCARLSYSTAPDVEHCPDERDVRDAVAARLGYDPFDAVHDDPSTTRDVIVVVKKSGKGIVGSLEVKGPNPGRRELESPSGDCREVVDALTVAIAIGLDPASLTGPALSPPPPLALPPGPPGASPPPSADRPESPPPPRDRNPVHVRVGVGPVVMFGELPSPAAGFVVSAAARYRAFEPTIEGLATLPVSQSGAVGSVDASLLAVTLLPCGRIDPLFACVGMTLGSLHGEASGVGGPLRGSDFYSAASVRGGAELPLGSSFYVRGYVEAVAPITRITLQLASQDVWRMSSVAARVGASVGVLF